MTKTPETEKLLSNCRHVFVCNCEDDGFLARMRWKDLPLEGVSKVSKPASENVVHNDTEKDPS